LYLFSPSFFNTQSDSFKNKQLSTFKLHQEIYIQTFYKKCMFIDEDIERFKTIDSILKLEKLLFYEWKSEILEKVIKKGITIKVFLGNKDLIVDIEKSASFFESYCDISIIKDVGHILK